MAEYEDLRQRHLADLAALLPEHVQRLRWPAERLRQERRDRLRDLLRGGHGVLALAPRPAGRSRPRRVRGGRPGRPPADDQGRP